jgi:hypothetical protein
MKYGISGAVNEGTVYVIVKEKDGKFEHEHLVVEIPGRGLPSKQIIIIEDGQNVS